MTNATLTFRVPANLRKSANTKAKRLGVPLSIVVRNALNDFVQSDAPIIISDPEIIQMPPAIQSQADRVMDALDRALASRGKTRA